MANGDSITCSVSVVALYADADRRSLAFLAYVGIFFGIGGN